MKNASWIALHGFLGRPPDWQSVLPAAHVIDLYQFGIPSAANCLLGWAESCVAAMRALPEPRVLIGYSLGGRLALHALLRDPHVWQALVIVSAHPGLTEPKERLERQAQDEVWAKRFESEPWERVITAWEAQPILAGESSLFIRRETDYNRAQLAATLRHWSLGQQWDLRSRLGEMHVPILWVAGANDSQHATFAKTIHLCHPRSRVWIAPNAGHRVPWQQPLLFSQQIEQFIGEL